MGYRILCDWCGACLYGEDYAELPVTIRRRRNSVLDARWAEEARPTLHFCVPSNAGDNRMGIEAQSDDGCFERARALLKGTPSEPPDMGLEWRLLPVGSLVHDPPRQGQEPEPDLAAILKPLPAHLRYVLPKAGITTLAQIDAMSDEQLLSIKGLGAKLLAALREAPRTQKGA